MDCFTTQLCPVILNRSVLEVASGTGILSRVLRDCGCGSLLTTDIDVRMVRHLKQQGFQSLCARGEQLPFADHSFDVIAIAQALHWLNIQTACSEFHRVLIDGTLVVIRMWPDETIAHVARIENAIRGGRPSKVTGTPRKLAGFRLIDITRTPIPTQFTQADVLDVMATRNRYLQSTTEKRHQIRRNVESVLHSLGPSVDFHHIGEIAIFTAERAPT